ncbi:MAG: aromatic ring-hydroxylating dioxygenase subunit alpha [Cyanobacteria bacterium]|nr:aromatic ring-hydroxylating dioxygenase subunit alpha [Cyanobacteriota bacterium]
MDSLADLPSGPFLPATAYGSARVAEAERRLYANRFWHPLAGISQLPPGSCLAVSLLGQPILLSHPLDGPPRAFLNRCPHRGVALQDPAEGTVACRRLVCPYHGWTYGLEGTLLAGAREADFLEPFERSAWPLAPLACQTLGSLIWVALAPGPIPLAEQLDLVLEEAGPWLEQPRLLLASANQELACNWKIAHDNTLDDYHVAIAHPTTLHREQGPVRHYRYRLSRCATLLATPHAAGGEFLTFGLAPWTHLLCWPDGRLALISFLPLDPGHCQMVVWLLGKAESAADTQAWLKQLQAFLAEDQALVEAAQIGYASGLVPGPPHRLEQRILQQQALYRDLLGKALLDPASCGDNRTGAS